MDSWWKDILRKRVMESLKKQQFRAVEIFLGDIFITSEHCVTARRIL